LFIDQGHVFLLLDVLIKGVGVCDFWLPTHTYMYVYCGIYICKKTYFTILQYM